MQWTDEGIVIGVKRHGEASAILELMTRYHGRHLGLVRGGFGTRMKPILQTGNSVSASWRARLDEHLGNYTVEALRQRASNFFASPHAIYGVTHLAALMRLLPERDPHAGLYSVFEEVLDRLEDPVLAAPLVVRFELQLLSELGFGLDLEQCASTGTTEELIYVSPKSGRAVSRSAGEPWADKMLRLPAFLRDLDAGPAGRDLADGFALTGFFLERHVLEPRGLTLTDERAHFIAVLLRGPRNALVVKRL
jgi:DNA repair protein RecO (recombination protein O)